jgi:nucleotide-binding universal stress UspA family protein
MSTRLLVPLDGSKTAEKVLPYARHLAAALKLPVELLAAIDVAEVASHIAAEKARFLDTMIEDGVRNSERYLRGVAVSFAGANVKCVVERERAEVAIIEHAAKDKDTLITMATHGRSGMNRFLLGSIAEKVLRATTNPLLLVRASDDAKTEGAAAVKTIIVPLDGSDLAESVLPAAVDLAKRLDSEIVLFRAYNIPYGAYSTGDGFYDPVNLDALLASIKDEASEYLARKTEELKRTGLNRVSFVAKEGFSADEIIAFGRETKDSMIAMCTHGRSGVKRFVLGSVTETVVRHSGEPVLVLRGAGA